VDRSFDLKALGIAAFAILVFSNMIGQYAVTYRYSASMSNSMEIYVEWRLESITHTRR
jgi:hypothetical protein